MSKSDLLAGAIRPYSIDGEVFSLRRYLTRAQCVMDDIMLDYFYLDALPADPTLALREFKRNGTRAEIVDDILDQLDGTLKLVEAAVDKAIAASEEANA